MTIRCPKCGSVIITTDGSCAYCGWHPSTETIVSNKTYPVGWQCPKCGSVYAPWVRECRICVHKIVEPMQIWQSDDKSSNDTQTQTIVYGKEDSEVQE